MFFFQDVVNFSGIISHLGQMDDRICGTVLKWGFVPRYYSLAKRVNESDGANLWFRVSIGDLS